MTHGCQRVPPHIRDNSGSRSRRTASGCVPPRSGDAVPSSLKQLLVTGLDGTQCDPPGRGDRRSQLLLSVVRHTGGRVTQNGLYDRWVRHGFDPQAMIDRFRARANAVRTRGLPPIEGPERLRFKEQMQVDFMDYAMLGDAQADMVDGLLTLHIDLRPKDASPEN